MASSPVHRMTENITNLMLKLHYLKSNVRRIK